MAPGGDTSPKSVSFSEAGLMVPCLMKRVLKGGRSREHPEAKFAIRKAPGRSSAHVA